MRSGMFNTQLFSVIENCTDVIVVLPPNALDRCSEANDWVRLELAYAMQKRKNIIPVFMRNFEFPENLPEDIGKIRFMQGVVASNEYFDAVMERIKKLLVLKNESEEPEVNLQEEYDRAVELLENHKFTVAANDEVTWDSLAALNIFKSLKDFSDSKQKRQLAKELYEQDVKQNKAEENCRLIIYLIMGVLSVGLFGLCFSLAWWICFFIPVVLLIGNYIALQTVHMPSKDSISNKAFMLWGMWILGAIVFNIVFRGADVSVFRCILRILLEGVLGGFGVFICSMVFDVESEDKKKENSEDSSDD